MEQLPHLDIIYTADEAAEKLKLTRRAVITNGKRYGLCFEVGRHVRFTETQLVKLVEAMQFKPVSSIGEKYVAAYNIETAYARLRVIDESEAQAKAVRKEERRSRMAAERELRRAAEAEERERKLEAKRQITRQREEAKAAKRAEKRAESLGSGPINLD